MDFGEKERVLAGSFEAAPIPKFQANRSGVLKFAESLLSEKLSRKARNVYSVELSQTVEQANVARKQAVRPRAW